MAGHSLELGLVCSWLAHVELSWQLLRSV